MDLNFNKNEDQNKLAKCFAQASIDMVEQWMNEGYLE